MKKIIIVLTFLCLLCSYVHAETVWVLCQPDSYVNVRRSASKKQEPNGTMECGWDAETNNKTKNGFIYVEVPNEDGYGWINKGYIVHSKPVIITFKTNIYSNGRVACWRSIGGNRRCWVKPGAEITVYAVSEEWSITNKGFVKTEYLGVNYWSLLNSAQ